MATICCINLAYRFLLRWVSIEIPMVTGKVKIKIPPGTKAEKLEITIKRDSDINGYGRGDMIVNIQIWTPQKLTKEEKELLVK